jgi:hypothetical protein
VADERPQYQHGVGTIGGSTFHWGSGTPGQYWSIPYGDYPVTPDAPTGAWAHQVGAIPIANNVIPDPVLHRNRIGIMIHSGSGDSLDELYTQGCFKVPESEWPSVRAEILSEAQKGPLYLHVAPGGVAAFSNSPTYSPASDNTRADNANTVANTTGSIKGNTGVSDAGDMSPFLPPGVTLNSLPMGMRNNNPANIKWYEGSPFGGVVGPSKNTDQGDPQFVFASPQAGMNAAFDLARRKYEGGMTTPAQFIAGQKGWTPGNMQAAANVAKSLGIGVNDDIGFNDPGKASQFMHALIKQEQGASSQYYPEQMYAGGSGGSGAPGQGSQPTVVASAEPRNQLGQPTGQPAPPPAATPGTSLATTTPAAAPAAPPSIWDKLTTNQKDAQGAEKPGTSPLAKLGADASKMFQAPQVGEMPQPQQAPDTSMAIYPMASQLFQQTLANASRPLTWSSAPYGSGQAGQQMAAMTPYAAPAMQPGPQIPGLTLNSLGMGSGYYG